MQSSLFHTDEGKLVATHIVRWPVSRPPAPATSGGWRAGPAAGQARPPGQTELCPPPGRSWSPVEEAGAATPHCWGADHPPQTTSRWSCSISTARLAAPAPGPADLYMITMMEISKSDYPAAQRAEQTKQNAHNVHWNRLLPIWQTANA